MFAAKLSQEALGRIMQAQSNEIFNMVSFSRANETFADLTMLATLRVLAGSRQERITCRVTRSVYGYLHAEIEATLRSEMQSCVLDPESNKIVFCEIPTEEFERAKQHYEKSKYLVLDVMNFIKEKIGLECIILTDTEARLAFVLTEIRLATPSFWHLIQSFIPKILPWIFENKELTEKELVLLNTLLKRSKNDYISALEDCYDEMNIREIFIETNFKNFELNRINRQIEELQNQITMQQRRADQAMQSFIECMKKKQDANIKINAMKIQQSAGVCDSDLMNYFLSNKNLELNNVSGDSFSFYCYTHMNNYDPEVYEQYINNQHSYFYRCSRWNSEDTKLILNAIFGEDSVLKLRFSGYYCLNFDVCCVTTMRYEETKRDYIGNPHIAHWRCLGDYPRYINEFLATGEMIGAVDQCFASAGSLNLNDGTVMDSFMSDLTGPQSHTFVELPDGKCVTPAEALKWLKERKENDSDCAE